MIKYDLICCISSGNNNKRIIYSFLFNRWQIVSVVKYQRAVHIRFYIRIDQNHDSVWQNVASVHGHLACCRRQDRWIIYA